MAQSVIDHGALGLDQASYRSGCLVIWSKARHSISPDHLRDAHVHVSNTLPSLVQTLKSHHPGCWLSPSTQRPISFPALSSFASAASHCCAAGELDGCCRILAPNLAKVTF
ncbi:hypothetical protein CGRA01v4_09106 [Colletotrichum graminicola]|nr:hypothetical protein CGRA01v4_09106 [Colletotrichum graminicola]